MKKTEIIRKELLNDDGSCIVCDKMCIAPIMTDDEGELEKTCENCPINRIIQLLEEEQTDGTN